MRRLGVVKERRCVRLADVSRLISALILVTLTALAGVFVAAPAHAGTVSWSGALVDGERTWNRPTCAALSGNIEWWQAQSFTVDQSGPYLLEMIDAAGVAPAGLSPDGYFLLYEDPFDPAVPTANCLLAIDDAIGLRPAATHNLVAGTTYTLVTTQCCDGITPSQEMTYTNQISGPGGVQLLRDPSITTLALPAAGNVFGDPFDLDAQVTSNLGDSRQGTVEFFAGGVSLGTAQIDAATGLASLTGLTLPAGDHHLTAVFSGNAQTESSTSVAATLTIAKRATTTTISLAPDTVAEGHATELTALVVGGSPSGTVTFRAGGDILGTASVAQGAASLRRSAFPQGTYAITASYNGDANHTASLSPAATLTVRAAPTRAPTPPPTPTPGAPSDPAPAPAKVLANTGAGGIDGRLPMTALAAAAGGLALLVRRRLVRR